MENDNLRCEACNREFTSQEAIDSHNKSKHHHSQKQNHTFPTKTVAIVVVLMLAIIGVAAFIVVGHKTANTPAGNTINPSSSDTVQTATLRVSGSNYILEPSTFKKDIPVKLIANINSMPGCSKSVTIPAFGILKYVTANDNSITFTPTKTGTFSIACSMSMYTGTFTVE